MRRHACHAIGCSRPVPMHVFMCSRHWKMVPPEIQRDLVAAWQSANKDGPRALMSDEWNAAADAATAAVWDVERAQIADGQAGVCAQCGWVVRLTKSGALFRHGPRLSPCQGSHEQPEVSKEST